MSTPLSKEEKSLPLAATMPERTVDIQPLLSPEVKEMMGKVYFTHEALMAQLIVDVRKLIDALGARKV